MQNKRLYLRLVERVVSQIRTNIKQRTQPSLFFCGFLSDVCHNIPDLALHYGEENAAGFWNSIPKLVEHLPTDFRHPFLETFDVTSLNLTNPDSLHAKMAPLDQQYRYLDVLRNTFVIIRNRWLDESKLTQAWIESDNSEVEFWEPVISILARIPTLLTDWTELRAEQFSREIALLSSAINPHYQPLWQYLFAHDMSERLP